MRKLLLTILLSSCFTSICAFAQLDKYYFVWVGRSMVMENRYKEAIETLNTLLRSDSDAYEAYFWRGIAKYHLDDLLGAEQDFTSTLDRNPVYTLAYQFRALTRTRLGDYEAALKDYQEAIDLRPDYPGPYFSRGVTNIMLHRYENAVADFNMYIRFVQKDADAYANRGLAYLNLRDTTAAMEDFTQAIRTNRIYPRGYLERGTLLAAQGDYDAALEDFDKAVECDTTLIQSYFSRASLHYRRGEYTAALKDFDKVIELDPTSSVTYFNRAIVRTEIGDYNRAMDDYDRVVELSPGNVVVYFNRAGLHSLLGDPELAIKDYDKAIELLPDFTKAYLNRATAKYVTGDTRGAERDRATAERKIEEYRRKLSTGEISPMADTASNFNQLLAFDTKMSRNATTATASATHDIITIRPLYRFTLISQTADTTAILPAATRKLPETINDFLRTVGDYRLDFTCASGDLSADALIEYSEKAMRSKGTTAEEWLPYFNLGIAQLQLRQYTNAVNSLTKAIELSPANPLLYMTRSAVLAEMTDFISSMDNEYSRISPDSNGMSGSNDGRVYNYDDAISDLNKAAKLAPSLAYIHYNRGNLHVLSGDFNAAADDYSRAITLDPTLAEAYFNRGLVKIYMGRNREGLLDVSKAGELGISDAYTVMKLYSPDR